MNSTYWG